MKLIIAIVHDEDLSKLIDALVDAGQLVTKLASTGGFLKTGNTTILMGVEDDKKDEVIKIIERNCESREILTSPSPMLDQTNSFMAMPISIKVGGATVFVLDTEQFIKL